jgi:hypothetical protein
MIKVLICCLYLGSVSLGCSVLLNDTVPMQWTPSEDVYCSGYTWPVLDASIAALHLFSVTMTFVDPYGYGYEPTNVSLIAAFSVFAGIVATSAVLGFCMAKECHDARELRDQWLDLGLIERDVLEEKWRDRRGLPALGGPE